MRKRCTEKSWIILSKICFIIKQVTKRHDEVSRMESIVELSNNNKNVIEFVTSNKENSNLQRDALHSKGKESILGE